MSTDTAEITKQIQAVLEGNGNITQPTRDRLILMAQLHLCQRVDELCEKQSTDSARIDVIEKADAARDERIQGIGDQVRNWSIANSVAAAVAAALAAFGLTK